MKTYLVLLASSLAQFCAHFSDRWVIHTFGNGWSQLFAYTLGTVVNAPFLDLLMAEFGISPKRRRLVMLLYFASFFFGGLGCLLGWVVRPSPVRSGKAGKRER